MKRIVAAVLLLLLLPVLCACAPDKEIVSPVSFHYLRTPQPNGEIHHGSADSVITAEIRESADHAKDYSYLLDIYLLGPLDANCRTPYPVGTFLEEFTLENGIAHITLSDNFGSLTGIDLTLACGCLTLTVMDLTGADTVIIRAEGTMLDGRESVTMDRSSIILTDNTVPETE